MKNAATPSMYPLTTTHCAAIILITTLSCTGPNPEPTTPPPSDDTQTESPFAPFSIDINGTKNHLDQGEFLIAMLSASCEHCRDVVPTLNTYRETPELPPVIGLLLGDDEEITQFRQLTKPNFPLLKLEPLEFFQFIDNAPPRLIHINDGVEKHSWEWEETAPKAEEVRAMLPSIEVK